MFGVTPMAHENMQPSEEAYFDYLSSYSSTTERNDYTLADRSLGEPTESRIIYVMLSITGNNIGSAQKPSIRIDGVTPTEVAYRYGYLGHSLLVGLADSEKEKD